MTVLSTVDDWKVYNQGTDEYDRLSTLLSSPDPIRWLFTGDSITHGVIFTGGYRTYSELFDNHLKTTPVRGVDRSGDTVMNTGVANGDTRQMTEHYKDWVAKKNADVVFIALGMNDWRQKPTPIVLEDYIANLSRFIDDIRAAGGIPILQTQNYANDASFTASLTQYFDAERKLAQEKGVMLMDVNKHFYTLNGNQAESGTYLSDSVHPSARGHIVWANFILDQLSMKKEGDPIDAWPETTTTLSTPGMPLTALSSTGLTDSLIDPITSPAPTSIIEENSLFTGVQCQAHDDLAAGLTNQTTSNITVRFKADKRDYQTLVSLSDKDSDKRLTIRVRGDNGKIQVARDFGNGFDFYTTRGATVTDGQFHTVSANIAASNLTVYVDGVQDMSIPLKAEQSLAYSRFSIDHVRVGCGSIPSSPEHENFTGIIDDVSFYNRALTPAELASVSAETRGATTPSGSAAIFAALQAEPNPTHTLFLGGTTTEGTYADNIIAKNYVQAFDEVLRWEKKYDGTAVARMKFVTNEGHDGLTVEDMAEGFDDYLSANNPDAVVIVPDLYDSAGQKVESDVATFTKHLTTMITKAKEDSLPVLLITPASVKGGEAEYAKAMVTLGAEQSVPVLDATTWLTDWTATSAGASQLTTDGLLNYVGQIELAKHLIRDANLVPTSSRIMPLTYITGTEPITEDLGELEATRDSAAQATINLAPLADLPLIFDTITVTAGDTVVGTATDGAATVTATGISAEAHDLIVVGTVNGPNGTVARTVTWTAPVPEAVTPEEPADFDISLTVANPKAGGFTLGDRILYNVTITSKTGTNYGVQVASASDTNLENWSPCRYRNFPAGTSATCNTATFQPYHDVTQADVEAGTFTPTMIYSVYADLVNYQGTPKGTIAATATPVDIVAPPVQANITLTIANPKPVYYVGDTITYNFEIANVSGKARAFDIARSNTVNWETCKPYNVAHNGSIPCNGRISHTVTEDDLAAGQFVAEVTVRMHAGTAYNNTTAVTLPVTKATPATIGTPMITATIAADGDDVNVGDKVPVTVTVTNVSETPVTIRVGESNIDLECTPTLAPGDKATCTGTYTATEQDVMINAFFVPNVTLEAIVDGQVSQALKLPADRIRLVHDYGTPASGFDPHNVDPTLEASMTGPVNIASQSGSNFYRIPALTVAPNGDLLASYDLRPGSAADAPNPNSIVQRRSKDGGKTWGPETYIAKGYTSAPTAAYSDPSYVVDYETGTIYNFHVLGFDNNFWAGRYSRDDQGNIKEADRKSVQLHLAVSTDNGYSWEHRVITNEVLKDHSDVLSGFATSGNGIQILTGKHKGRLVQPYAWQSAPNEVKAAVVYSDDHGQTWKRGALTSRVDDNGVGGYVYDENKVVELEDGRLMLNSRSGAGPAAGYRLVAYSSDGGETWSNPTVEKDLIDPTNNATIIRAYPTAKAGTAKSKVLLFSNSRSKVLNYNSRVNGAITVSCDSGESWDHKNATTFVPGYVGYSSIAIQPDGSIGILHEAAGSGNIVYRNMTMAALGTQCAMAPELKVAAADTTVSTGDEVSIDVTVTGGEGVLAKDVEVTGLPEGLSYANGKITGTATEPFDGTVTITATQEDDGTGEVATASTTMKLRVDASLDLEELTQAVAAGEAVDREAVTPASYGPLEKALAEAEVVLADEDATQEEVDNAAKAVREAIAGVVDRADLTELDAVLAEAGQASTEGKTADSVKALNDAVAAAEAVKADLNATQEQVDAAAEAVCEAIEGLADEPVTPVDPDPVDPDPVDPDPVDPVDPVVPVTPADPVDPVVPGPVASKGNLFFFTQDWVSTVAQAVIAFGRAGDDVFVGDFDGDGRDTIAVRRGTTMFVLNSLVSGQADVSFELGRVSDEILVGDWDGDGIATFGVRRGRAFMLSNSLGSDVDVTVYYGRPSDEVLVGDWDGDGVDTLGVRRGKTLFLKNSIASGIADVQFAYGKVGDELFVGDFDGDGRDTIAVRRGNAFYVNNGHKSGWADVVLRYGKATDRAFLGDWNGNNSDTLVVNRSVR